MGIKEGLQAYITLQSDLLLKNLWIAQKNYDMEAIHQLRVSIKKIKAILNLLAYLQPKRFDKKVYWKLWKSLFKAAGQVRDTQVQEKLLQEYEKPLQAYFFSFLEYLLIQKNEAKEVLDKKLHKIDIDHIRYQVEKIKSSFECLDEATINQKIIALIYVKIQQIHRLSKENKEEEEIHDLRKLVKEVLYILELVNEYTAEIQLPKKSLKKIKKLGESLGKWHDREVMLQYLHILAKVKVNRLPKYQRLKSKVHRENKVFLARLDDYLLRIFTKTLHWPVSDAS